MKPKKIKPETMYMIWKPDVKVSSQMFSEAKEVSITRITDGGCYDLGKFKVVKVQIKPV